MENKRWNDVRCSWGRERREGICQCMCYPHELSERQAKQQTQLTRSAGSACLARRWGEKRKLWHLSQSNLVNLTHYHQDLGICPQIYCNNISPGLRDCDVALIPLPRQPTTGITTSWIPSGVLEDSLDLEMIEITIAAPSPRKAETQKTNGKLLAGKSE